MTYLRARHDPLLGALRPERTAVRPAPVETDHAPREDERPLATFARGPAGEVQVSIVTVRGEPRLGVRFFSCGQPVRSAGAVFRRDELTKLRAAIDAFEAIDTGAHSQ
jgi:hypothetical protein